MKKIESISTAKYKQLDNKAMQDIKGGKETSTTNHNGTSYPDTFDYWTDADGTPDNTGGTKMDGLKIAWNNPIT